jgi:hypothetical protein
VFIVDGLAFILRKGYFELLGPDCDGNVSHKLPESNVMSFHCVSRLYFNEEQIKLLFLWVHL